MTACLCSHGDSHSDLFCFCPGGPSDAPSPDFHQLRSPLHPQRPEALWQQTAHAQVYPGTECGLLETNILKLVKLNRNNHLNCCPFFSSPPNILSAGGAETFPRWRSSARPCRWHGHQGPCTEESDSESGGFRAPHVLPPPAQWPQLGICLFSLWEESCGEKLYKCAFQFVGESAIETPAKCQTLLNHLTTDHSWVCYYLNINYFHLTFLSTLATFLLDYNQWPSIVFSSQTGRLWSYILIQTNTGRKQGHYSYRVSPSVIGQITENLLIRSHQARGNFPCSGSNSALFVYQTGTTLPVFQHLLGSSTTALQF